MTASLAPADAEDLPLRIEDYALIGDCRTGALVGRNGSIDWLCWPRFDSGACFAALLGSSRHGRWLLAPAAAELCISRAYRGDTNVLETLFDTADGSVAVIDFMPTGRADSSVVRRVEGRRGRVAMRMQLTLRFDYGSATPRITRLEDGGISALVGPNLVVLRTAVRLEERDRSILAEITVGEGESVDFALTWGSSHLPVPAPFDIGESLRETVAFWEEWSGRCTYRGRWEKQVRRSLLMLKALTYAPTGGMIAALTTSLPEEIGGERNWDYRYCWLRDSTLTLVSLIACGYAEEAQAWSEWLRRAVPGEPEELQIMYGLDGERCLVEWSPSWLPGYEGSAPVRIGNAASAQFQLDVYGEVIGTFFIARRHGLTEPDDAWSLQRLFVEHLISIWEEPDEGIWEVRSGRRQFTYSKVMAWVAMDRSVKDAEWRKLEAPLERWREVRDRMHAQICDQGFDRMRNTFTQSYGSPELDASLLLIPRVGFLPAEDERVRGTVAAIERELLVDGFVLRYRTDADGGPAAEDGLKGGEGVFLPCSFWLVNAYKLLGRDDDAQALFDRLLGLANDLGLLSEEYDPRAGRQVGNVPQAFSHVGLISAAFMMDGVEFAWGPADPKLVDGPGARR